MSAKTIFEIDDAWLIEGGGTEHLNGRPALNAPPRCGKWQ